jgi:hypothetical protein
MLLDWILKKWGCRVWTGFIWQRIGRCDWPLVKAAVNCQVPFSAGYFSRGLPLVGFSASMKFVKWVCYIHEFKVPEFYNAQNKSTLSRLVIYRAQKSRNRLLGFCSRPRPYFTVSFETPPSWRARSPYLYPPGTGWPSFTPGHWVWSLKLKLMYDRQPVCLGVGHPTGTRDQFFFLLEIFRDSYGFVIL